MAQAKTNAPTRADAEAAVSAGDVEQCWYLHGCVDRLEGLASDPVQANDDLYGSYYRAGFAGLDCPED